MKKMILAIMAVTLMLQTGCNGSGNTTTEYFSNGEKDKEYVIKDGKKNGLYQSWHENGELAVIGNYKNDKAEGEFKKYYESGELYSKSNYKNGEAEGEFRWYYEDGSLKQKSKYLNDKEHGKTLLYDRNGVLRKIFEYDNGDLIEETCFDSDGNEVSCEKRRRVGGASSSLA